MDSRKLWLRHKRYLCRVPTLGLALDINRMRFDDRFFERMAPSMRQAFAAMDALERGAIANPDENRMVGHYWLRNPDLVPTQEIGAEIRKTVQDVKAFAQAVHDSTIRPPSAGRFTRLLSIGIGGSALGPMFTLSLSPEPDTTPDPFSEPRASATKLNMAGANLDDNGNLDVLGLGTRDLRPGFRYVLGVVSKNGVKTINKKALPEQ